VLSYSTHARERMEERDITEDEVINALKRTTGPPRPGDRGNIVVYGYGSGSRILKIVLTSDRQTVVSVMPVGE
jgi:Domain of unknown function (DUF4258)